MAKKNEKKTNAMRELDRIGAAYDTHIWDCAEAMNGVEAPIMSSWCRLLKSSI